LPLVKSKENDPRIPTLYRGISLINCAAKLYSAVLNLRISKYLEENSGIEDEQNGFWKNRRCTDHVFAFDSIVRNRVKQNLSIFTTFIDFQKAFDCVQRDMLMYNFYNKGINGKMYFAVKSLYLSTEACVKVNNLYTPWFDYTYGVKQGDSLSPTLFNIFIDDLAKNVKDKAIRS